MVGLKPQRRVRRRRQQSGGTQNGERLGQRGVGGGTLERSIWCTFELTHKPKSSKWFSEVSTGWILSQP